MSQNFLNLCYNIAGKREDIEVDDQENRPRGRKMRPKSNARAAARRAIANEQLNVRKHNTAVKLEAFRGVRRPGKDHAHLLQVLDQLLGALDERKDVIREVVAEALRFKRRALAQILEEYMVEMDMKANNIGRPGICLHCAFAGATPLCTCKGRNIG